MPSNSHVVCVACRIVSVAAPSCGHEGVRVSSKWRAPRKANDRAWKRIAAGDWLWDTKAVIKKAQERRQTWSPWERRAWRLEMKKIRDARTALRRAAPPLSDPHTTNSTGASS